MKFKLTFAATALVLLSIFSISNRAMAQSNWELGLRFGNDIGIDATIPLSVAPRLHTTASFDDHFALGTYFDWMFMLSEGPSGLKFYPGVGPEFYFGDEFDFGVAGDFGVEYSFKFPLTFGIDWRPGFIVADGLDFHSNNWGIMARFRFGEGVHFKKVK